MGSVFEESALLKWWGHFRLAARGRDSTNRKGGRLRKGLDQLYFRGSLIWKKHEKKRPWLREKKKKDSWLKKIIDRLRGERKCECKKREVLETIWRAGHILGQGHSPTLCLGKDVVGEVVKRKKY